MWPWCLAIVNFYSEEKVRRDWEEHRIWVDKNCFYEVWDHIWEWLHLDAIKDQMMKHGLVSDHDDMFWISNSSMSPREKADNLLATTCSTCVSVIVLVTPWDTEMLWRHWKIAVRLHWNVRNVVTYVQRCKYSKLIVLINSGRVLTDSLDWSSPFHYTTARDKNLQPSWAISRTERPDEECPDGPYHPPHSPQLSQQLPPSPVVVISPPPLQQQAILQSERNQYNLIGQTYSTIREGYETAEIQ